MMEEAQGKVPPQEKWPNAYMMIGIHRHILDQKYCQIGPSLLCKNVYKFLGL